MSSKNAGTGIYGVEFGPEFPGRFVTLAGGGAEVRVRSFPRENLDPNCGDDNFARRMATGNAGTGKTGVGRGFEMPLPPTTA